MIDNVGSIFVNKYKWENFEFKISEMYAQCESI